MPIQSKNHVNIPMFVLTILVVIVTALFIIRYCYLFDDLGILAKRRLLDHPILTFFITPSFFWISAYLCRRYSPNASGHKLQSALYELKNDPDNFRKVSSMLGIRVVMIKAISSLISTFGGGALGKEGPSVHMSAGIFATLSHRYKKFLPQINLETWVLAGTATGLAIAFNTPIAGIVFVIEKLSKTKFQNFKKNILWTLIIISIVTIIFHRPNPLFNFHNLIFRLQSESWLLIFTAVTCGFLALIFQSANNYFYLKLSGIKSNWWHTVPLIAGFAVAFINFYCGIYSFSGGIYTAQEALSNPTSILSYKEVGGRILNTVITFASGCAGGLIAPAMAIGTGIGSIVSTLTPGADIGVFLLIGMAAFLGAVLGEPITAAVVIFEATGQDIASIPFLLGAAIIALATSKGMKKILSKKCEVV